MKAAKLLGDSIVEFCEENILLRDFAYAKINSISREDKDDAFHICDLGDIMQKWKKWCEVLPQVHPYYAVKCNPDQLVLSQLQELGVNYDCASKGEIKSILQMGISPGRIIFANPCKQISHIKYAKLNNVNLMTFDNEPELHKIKHHHPHAELIIRIKVDDSKSLCKFGVKFGVDPSHTRSILETAWNLGLHVAGVSFHVGSGCFDASLFYQAVKLAKNVFNQGNEVGYNFKILDIGGGFPGHTQTDISFEAAAWNLNRGFAEYFPSGCGVKIIAEPGRYFVASAYTTVCNVTSVREVTSDTKVDGYMYYLNDGVYGSFNCILFDHQHPQPRTLRDVENGEELFECSVWGPTCDSLDCISASVKLPKLSIGEWIVFDNMGAYTMAAASMFNGFNKPKLYYMCRVNHDESNSVPPMGIALATCKQSAKIQSTPTMQVTSVY